MSVEPIRRPVRTAKTVHAVAGASPLPTGPGGGSVHHVAVRGSEPRSWQMAAPSFMILSTLPRK
ncbi:hypothetical protein ABZY31_07975 [Streptomyces sp. NPDC006529]|uniref:hypothetical protein n=1 Tax=Streptomyces sp. NPDC006529 TaxID=3157177 RepID=UPI0033B517FF